MKELDGGIPRRSSISPPTLDLLTGLHLGSSIPSPSESRPPPTLPRKPSVITAGAIDVPFARLFHEFPDHVEYTWIFQYSVLEEKKNVDDEPTVVEFALTMNGAWIRQFMGIGPVPPVIGQQGWGRGPTFICFCMSLAHPSTTVRVAATVPIATKANSVSLGILTPAQEKHMVKLLQFHVPCVVEVTLLFHGSAPRMKRCMWDDWWGVDPSKVLGEPLEYLLPAGEGVRTVHLTSVAPQAPLTLVLRSFPLSYDTVQMPMLESLLRFVDEPTPENQKAWQQASKPLEWTFVVRVRTVAELFIYTWSTPTADRVLKFQERLRACQFNRFHVQQAWSRWLDEKEMAASRMSKSHECFDFMAKHAVMPLAQWESGEWVTVVMNDARQKAITPCVVVEVVFCELGRLWFDRMVSTLMQHAQLPGCGADHPDAWMEYWYERLLCYCTVDDAALIPSPEADAQYDVSCTSLDIITEAPFFTTWMAMLIVDAILSPVEIKATPSTVYWWTADGQPIPTGLATHPSVKWMHKSIQVQMVVAMLHMAWDQLGEFVNSPTPPNLGGFKGGFEGGFVNPPLPPNSNSHIRYEAHGQLLDEVQVKIRWLANQRSKFELQFIDEMLLLSTDVWNAWAREDLRLVHIVVDPPTKQIRFVLRGWGTISSAK